MSRWHPPSGDPIPPEEPEVTANVPMPWDAETLEEVIDRRFKALLSLCSDSKDLTKALEAAAKWMAVKHELRGGEAEGWGARLKGGTLS